MKIEEYEQLIEKIDGQIGNLSLDSNGVVDLESNLASLEKEKADLLQELSEREELVTGLTDQLEKVALEQAALQQRIEELESREPEVIEKVVEVPVEDNARVDQLVNELAKVQAEVDKRDQAIERLAAKYELVEKHRNKPNLGVVADDEGVPGEAGFGPAFPENPTKGQMHLRVDFLPSRLYKWNGIKWIQVDKETTDSYTSEEYIEHVVDKLSSGELDLEDLTAIERDLVEDMLNQRGDLGK